MSVFNDFSKIKLTKTIPKTILFKTPGTSRTLSTNGVRNTSYRFQSAEPPKRKRELVEKTKDRYPNLKLNSYEYQEGSEYPDAPKYSGVAFIIIEKKVDGNHFIATHVEDRVPLNINVPLLENSLMFDGVDLTGIHIDRDKPNSFDFLNEYRYNRIGLRERDTSVSLEERVIKGIAEEIHAQFIPPDAHGETKENESQPERQPDFWLGRKDEKRGTVSWQPWFIISRDDLEPTDDKRNVMTNAFSSKAFKFDSQKLFEAINRGRLGRDPFLTIPAMLAHYPEFLTIDDKNAEIIKLKNPYGEVQFNGFLPEDTFVSQNDAKEYLENYLTRVQNIKNNDVNTGVNTGVNPLAAKFELSRWGEEGLLDNWPAIMAIINQK